jgi:hypothetical protein
LTQVAPKYIESLSESSRADAITVLNRVLQTAADFNTELAASSVDAALTPQGRAMRSAKASASAIAQLDAVTGEITKLTDRATALETALRAKVTLKVDAPPETLREIGSASVTCRQWSG